MWDDEEDLLELETSPELKAAAKMLEQAGESVASDSLPLKKIEALCNLRCFDRITDPWNMTISEKRTALDCVEKCEEPMDTIGDVIEDERNKMLEATTSCLERCGENDEACANRCITQSFSPARVDQMMQRVRARIMSFRY
jgi:hypothetical protein